MLLLLFWRVGFSPIEASTATKLIRGGFPKEFISLTSTLMTPLSLIIPLVAGRYYRPNREMDVWNAMFLLRVIDYVMTYLFVIFQASTSLYYTLYVISSIYSTVYSNVSFINSGNLLNRISDVQAGGTFITFLASCSNFGGTGTTSASLYLLEIVSYDLLICLGLVYTLGFYLLVLRRQQGLQLLPKEAFKLH